MRGAPPTRNKNRAASRFPVSRRSLAARPASRVVSQSRRSRGSASPPFSGFALFSAWLHQAAPIQRTSRYGCEGRARSGPLPHKPLPCNVLCYDGEGSMVTLGRPRIRQRVAGAAPSCLPDVGLRTPGRPKDHTSPTAGSAHPLSRLEPPSGRQKSPSLSGAFSSTCCLANILHWQRPE